MRNVYLWTKCLTLAISVRKSIYDINTNSVILKRSACKELISVLPIILDTNSSIQLIAVLNSTIIIRPITTLLKRKTVWAFTSRPQVWCLTQYIKNNAWVTVNNDFLATSGVICQWFSRVTKSRVKIIGKTPHEWPKIVIHGNECTILFLTRYFISWTYRSATNNHRSPISPLSPGTVFSDLTLWRHHSWSVTSREREALALWRNIHRLF